MLDEALEKNELFEFLTGQKGYYKPNPYSDTPMDDEYVADCIEKKYQSDQTMFDKILKAVTEISEDSSYSWFALYYIKVLISLKRRNHIEMDLSSYFQSIVDRISSHKASLEHDKRWLGHMWNNGLWGEVQRMVANINSFDGYELIINRESL